MDTATGINGVGVNEIDGHIGTGVMNQACCGVNDQRRTNDNHDIGRLHLFGSNSDIWHCLAKEYDIGAQQRAVASLRARGYLTIVGRQLYLIAGIVDIATGAG